MGEHVTPTGSQMLLSRVVCKTQIRMTEGNAGHGKKNRKYSRKALAA